MQLFALAVSIGIVVTLGESLVRSAALGRPVDPSKTVDVIDAALVSIPFLVLAARSSMRFLPWAMTFVLTAALHWWWLAKGIAYQRSPDGSGVDMFGALIMLLSPLPLTALAVAVDVAVKRRR